MKILPLSRYKLTKTGFVPVYVCPKRILFLLLVVFSVIGLFGYKYRDDLIVKPHTVDVELSIPEKSPMQTKMESYVERTNPKLSSEQVEGIVKNTIKYAHEANVDPYLLLGLLKVESTFNPYAINLSGATGMSQVILGWHKDKIEKLVARFGEFNVFNIEHSIALGSMVLHEYKVQTKSVKKALAKYGNSSEYPELVMIAMNEAKQ